MNAVRMLTSTFSLLILGSFLGGCAPADSDLPNRPPTGVVHFDPNISADQTTLLREDIGFVKGLGRLTLDPKLVEYLKLPDTSSTSLLNELNRGVHFILSDKFILNGNVYVEKEDYSYPNPGVMPVMDGGDETQNNRAAAGSVLANNLGSAIYLQGKLGRKLLSVDVPGFGKVAVDSPLDGVVQIGPGLFNLTQFTKISDPNDPANRILRFSVLHGHERWHGNGSGKSLGFFHMICPAGHDYAGSDVCDRAKNGAYAIGGYIVKGLMDSTPNLPESSKYVLNAFIADSLSRVVAGNAKTARSLSELDAPEWESTPEGNY